MTDYTPTTEQVRNAYVRGMRDTFIASAGEHQEEFDRWMQAHDAEVRTSAHPPTREQIAAYADDQRARARLIRDEQRGEWWNGVATARLEVANDLDAMLALFPQPEAAK